MNLRRSGISRARPLPETAAVVVAAAVVAAVVVVAAAVVAVVVAAADLSTAGTCSAAGAPGSDTGTGSRPVERTKVPAC